MKRYVAGLLFDDIGSQIALIQKNRPAWQAGFFNAIGGKIEPGESAYAAMKREFIEEAGVELDWVDHMIIKGHDFEVSFFNYFSSDALSKVSSITDEPISVFSISNLPDKLVDNLTWLIPMMADKTIELPIMIYKH